jgi:hypothetical protein
MFQIKVLMLNKIFIFFSALFLSADPYWEFSSEIWGSCAVLLRIQVPSILLRCAVGWVIPDISKEHNDKNSSRTAWSLEMKMLWSFRVLGPTYPATHCHILEDLNPQEWWLDMMQSSDCFINKTNLVQGAYQTVIHREWQIPSVA